MTDSRPEIKAEASVDGELVRLKLSKRNEGFPAVEYEFLLSKEEAMALAIRLAWAIGKGSFIFPIGSLSSVSNCRAYDCHENKEIPLEKTWRDQEPML